MAPFVTSLIISCYQRKKVPLDGNHTPTNSGHPDISLKRVIQLSPLQPVRQALTVLTMLLSTPIPWERALCSRVDSPTQVLSTHRLCIARTHRT